MSTTAGTLNPALMALVREESEANAREAAQEAAFLETVGIAGIKHSAVRHREISRIMREKPSTR